jgi:hypothetical protein
LFKRLGHGLGLEFLSKGRVKIRPPEGFGVVVSTYMVHKSRHSDANCRTGTLHGLRFSMSGNFIVLHRED